MATDLETMVEVTRETKAEAIQEPEILVLGIIQVTKVQTTRG